MLSVYPVPGNVPGAVMMNVKKHSASLEAFAASLRSPLSMDETERKSQTQKREVAWCVQKAAPGLV